MKDFWQSHLVDILAIVFQILVICCDCWLDYGNSIMGFFPFHLVDVSWTLFLLLLLLCRQEKLVHVLRKYIGSIFESKITWKPIEQWNWEWSLHILWMIIEEKNKKYIARTRTSKNQYKNKLHNIKCKMDNGMRRLWLSWCFELINNEWIIHF
jgi:hypothetical protein